MTDTAPSAPGPDDFVIYDTFGPEGAHMVNPPEVPEPTAAELEEARKLLEWAHEQAAKDRARKG